MGKIADTKLEQMGGTRICPLGQGDDDGRYFLIYYLLLLFLQSRRGLHALARDILAACVRGLYFVEIV